MELATGADRAIRVNTTDSALDGRLVAKALAKVVEQQAPDLVLMGKQTVDGESNFVAQALAELIDFPMATFAATIKQEEGSVLVGREVDGGTMNVRLRLPALVSVEMFRVEQTYELMIARHEARAGKDGKPPFVFSQAVFFGRHGHLSLELWGRDREAAGEIAPEFFTHSGERHEIPVRFSAAVRAATKGVTRLGCKSAQFAHAPAELLSKINASIDFDKLLYRQDIAGSIAHAKMLAKQGIIGKGDAKEIVSGLKAILKRIEEGKFDFKVHLEDIHMNIESALKDKIGKAAGRLHTARSRNDQVATAFRLYVRDAIDALDIALQALQGSLLRRAEQHADTLMPGGVMGGVFGSGSISDYIQSLERLKGLNSKILLSGHGRLSDTPQDDVRIALQRSHALLSDTAELFDALDARPNFEPIMQSVRDLNKLDDA